MRKSVLKGLLGQGIQRSIDKRFKELDYALLEEPFRLRNEEDNAWRCEFWGKIIRSAVTAAWAADDAELKKLLEQTVRQMMAAQTPDGCISSYPEEKQLGGWDIWGRKYVLLALIRYYEMLDPAPEVLECCCRMADHLMKQVKAEEGGDLVDYGWHNGLAASSILGAIVALWRLTGKEKYLAFAENIINSGCSSLGNIFDDIDGGILPSSLGNGKAYEMTSCVQGAVELELLKSTPGRKETAQRYYEAVRDREIFVTGAAGGKDRWGEYWCDGALRQTRPGKSVGLGETCVTATWIHYCVDMLQLTDDPAIADELEKSLYNGILGALAPDGTHWMHVNPTPLTGTGFKTFADDQIGRGFGTPYGGNDCCRAQGPEGLVTAAAFAVMEKENTLTVNLFEELESGELCVKGNYPVEPEARISFTEKSRKTLRLRTPEFLKKVTLNGEELPFTCGKYLVIDREWSCEDEVIMTFDFDLKEIPAPDRSPYVAVKRGPLVLAADSRGVVPDAAVNTVWKGTALCDYASAGNLFSAENTLTVWFKK